MLDLEQVGRPDVQANQPTRTDWRSWYVIESFQGDPPSSALAMVYSDKVMKSSDTAEFKCTK